MRIIIDSTPDDAVFIEDSTVSDGFMRRVQSSEQEKSTPIAEWQFKTDFRELNVARSLPEYLIAGKIHRQ